VPLRTVSVKFVGFLAMDGEEVGAGVIGPQWIEELFEGGMQAESNSSSQQQFGGRGNRLDRRTTLGRAGPSLTLVVEALLVRSPRGMVGPSGLVVGEDEGFGARSRGPSNLRCATGVEPFGSECRYLSHAILSYASQMNSVVRGPSVSARIGRRPLP